ncbi:hypothetical protein GA0061098_1006175 [Bradyrhizobium shewense]|uniref:Uncharacterized protein n=1 Tax=Bradyrhizobium shewense TaxID=1761772 RepID=A0A1C3W1P7_9BRAD|nr:hypothetical protein [Bradyrhizobium shewense]SCB33866.1 hypothetical protein GA0061098_1006175 [Bradyrhizobium shewense]
MTALASYSTGLATVSAGGTTITGSGAIWSGTSVKPGDIFQIGNFQSVISDVTDTTHLVIPPWGGGNQSGVAYVIWQVSPQRFAGAEAMSTVGKLVAAFETSGFYVFVGIDETEPDPSLGNDGQFAFQPTTAKLWEKVGGVWTYLGIFKAFNLTGAYDSVRTYSYGDVQVTSGSSYIYINDTPSAGHTAPNTTYWQLLASKGDASTVPGPGYGGTSTTSLTIGTGSKAFTTQSGLAYTNGARVRASSAANTSNWMEGLATYSGTTLTINVDKTNGSGTLADWNFNIVGEPGAGAGVAVGGQCQFQYSSSTSGILMPKRGNQLFVNGSLMSVPSAGVGTGTLGSLTSNTLYYAYAYISGGSIALEVSTTGHATDTTYGHEIKSGDASRSLVGMFYTNGSGQLVSTANSALVRSWYNRQATATRAAYTADRNNSGFGGAIAEVNSEIRNSVVLWADEVWDITLVSTFSLPSTGQSATVGIGLDAMNAWQDGAVNYNSDTGGNRMVAPVNYKATGLSDGFHYSTLITQTVSGVTATFSGSATSASFRTILTTAILAPSM